LFDEYNNMPITHTNRNTPLHKSYLKNLSSSSFETETSCDNNNNIDYNFGNSRNLSSYKKTTHLTYEKVNKKNDSYSTINRNRHASDNNRPRYGVKKIKCEY
jgi:hypothetical protein